MVHWARVQELAESVVMADDVITDEENAILQELHVMLYATEPPPTLPPLNLDD